MPECKALRTFNSDKYGFIRLGARFSSERGYAQELRSKGLIEILPDPIEPKRVQAFAHAPLIQGKDPPSADPPPPAAQNLAASSNPRSTEDPPAAGEATPSLLSRVDRVLRRPTSRRSRAGAKP